jgi:hypothetical protein
MRPLHSPESLVFSSRGVGRSCRGSIDLRNLRTIRVLYLGAVDERQGRNNRRTLERRGDSLKASQDIGSDFVVGLQISRVTYKFVEVANLAPRMLFHTGD